MIITIQKEILAQINRNLRKKKGVVSPSLYIPPC